MMAFPTAIETGADATIVSPGLLLAARIFFGLLTAIGLWLTYVGWFAPSTKPVANPEHLAGRPSSAA